MLINTIRIVAQEEAVPSKRKVKYIISKNVRS